MQLCIVLSIKLILLVMLVSIKDFYRGRHMDLWNNPHSVIVFSMTHVIIDFIVLSYNDLIDRDTVLCSNCQSRSARVETQ